MNALRLDPSERVFSTFYEPTRRRRLTRRHLVAIGVTAAVYGALGYYFVTLKYDLAPMPIFSQPTVVEGSWTVIEEPPPPEPTVKQEQPPRPIPARTPNNTIPIDVPPSPVAATSTPTGDAMPTTADPAPTPPLTTAEPPAPVAASTTPGVIRNPVWIRRPSPEEVGRLYPERAAERGITGSATLWCGIRANGTMTDCQVVDESPTGWRFGRAALSMAQYFRISPQTVDGKAVEGSRVRIPVVFALPE